MSLRYAVAAVQTDLWPVVPEAGGPPVPGNRDRNLARAIQLIRRQARWNPARLYVLPEFFLTGSGGVGRPGPARDLMCVTLPGPELEPLAALAREIGAFIAGMVFEVIPRWPDRYWNTAFILDPRGEVILRYRKHYDPTGITRPGDVLAEYVEHFGEDALFPVVDTEIGRLACLTCYDINFPEVARALALKGAEVLIHPTAEGRAPFLMPDTGGWDLARRVRAYENLCFLVSANLGRTRESDLPEERMGGSSRIINWDGRVLVAADSIGELILQTEIDLGELRRQRGQRHMNFLAPEVHALAYRTAGDRS
jgi:predicted amidohydrolase